MTSLFNCALEQAEFQEFLQSYTIKVLAPASGLNPEKLTLLNQAPIKNWDLSKLVLTTETTFHSNTDAQRLKELLAALYAENNTSLIWTLRGGYGSARLIEGLLKMPKPPQEKLFLGFSDITALHLFLSQHWNWNPIHGPALSQLLDKQLDPLSFIKLKQLISEKPSTLLSELRPLNKPAAAVTSLSGKLTGGNLTMVETSIGTPWQIQSREKILFLEDVGEKGYRLDRSLNHLKQAGLLQQIGALIFGEFTDETQDHTISIALERFAAEASFPVYKTQEFGHGLRNYPLQYNRLATLVPSLDTYSLIKT